MKNENEYVQWLSELDNEDVRSVGGKNASLGEMLGSLLSTGIRVPDGFATTAAAFREFMKSNDLNTTIKEDLENLKSNRNNLAKIGKKIRREILKADFPDGVASAIRQAYKELSNKYNSRKVSVAVRSSATAEDLPDASFAGQQDTYLNVRGADDVLEACRKCFASLYTDRAISYREEKGFDHLKVALSAGVQKMVRSDLASSGVMFSIDTETGFPGVVVINAAWGLGENVVQGAVNPDEYLVAKPLLGKDSLKPIIGITVGSKKKKMVYASRGPKATRNVKTTKSEQNDVVLGDDEILQLAGWARAIEKHYGKPMDMEWAKDGKSGDLYIVQARPETVQSRKDKSATMKKFSLKKRGRKLVEGLAVGEAIAAGKTQIIKRADEIDKFEDDSILVTTMTDPDWVPIMKRASGIITDHGGRTSHAAIVSRELGIPAIVGTGSATEKLKDSMEITMSCAEGDVGFVYKGLLEYSSREINVEDVPKLNTSIRMNIASPAAAFRWWRLPSDGIGLARMEFIINNVIKIHPLALLNFDQVKDKKIRREIKDMTAGFDNMSDYFVHHLSRGIARIAASQYPRQVLLRMSDFKTNEYANLIGGQQFEKQEENPMLGFRGASRYYSDRYRDAFALECRAVKHARESIGLDNVAVMIPFCRTVAEADNVLRILSDNGLVRGEKGLEVWVMCEIPSNIILTEEFAKRFDGFSIGSNDLTQLILGVDRDSEELSDIFDEQDEAVKGAITDLIKRAHAVGRKVSICGQAPSDHPQFAEFLVRQGIDSISLNPDSVMGVIDNVASVEKTIEQRSATS